MSTFSFSPTRGKIGAKVILSGDFNLTWRSAWVSGTTYKANDVVSYQGTYYISRFPQTGMVPSGIFGWDLLSEMLSFKLGLTQLYSPRLIDSNHIEVTIPPVAVSDKFSIKRNWVTSTTSTLFKIIYEPEIHGIQVWESNPIDMLVLDPSNPWVTAPNPYQEVPSYPLENQENGSYSMDLPNYCKIVGDNFGDIASVWVNGVPTKFVVHNHKQLTSAIDTQHVSSVLVKTTAGYTADDSLLGFGVFKYGLSGYGGHD